MKRLDPLTERRLPVRSPAVCVCKEWSDEDRCWRDNTADDHLCDGCSRVVMGDVIAVHVVFGVKAKRTRAASKHPRQAS